MNEQRNLLLAIALAVSILVGFNYFYEAPRQAQVTEKQTETKSTQAPEVKVVEEVTPELPRSQALEKTQRVQLMGDKIHGSINLQGGRFDDVTLVDYHETPDPQSPEVILLSPNEAKNGYFVDFGWVSQTPNVTVPTPTTVWQSPKKELHSGESLNLTWTNPQGLVFERQVSLDQKYMFRVTEKVTNKSHAPIQLQGMSKITRVGTPQTGGYYILHEGPIGIQNGKLVELDYAALKEKKTVEMRSTGGWLGITDKYWLVSLIPDQKTEYLNRFYIQTVGGQERYHTESLSPEFTVAPGESKEVTYHLFAGAKKLRMLDAYEHELGFDKFDLAIDFGWFYFLTKPLFYILEYLQKILGNLGIAILVLTIAIKILFFPLANKSYRSMSRMKQLQPKIEQLKQRYGDDKLKMNQELMGLYKKEQINPLSGCLPMLIQIPVFFCLYKVLFVTLEMRHAPFFGWIQDLSAPDPTTIFNLFGLIPFTPPSFLMIGAWPIIMGLTMFLQQKMNPQPADPAQAKAFLIMPIMLTFLLSSFPAGLVIYWAWNNIISIAQQWAIMRLESKPVSSRK
jgi:YidC/Oxa1 family membrane protein insertase